MRRVVVWAAPVLVAGAIAHASVVVGGDRPPFDFIDIAREAGVDTPTWCGRAEKPHILESNGTGLGLFDYDRDGDLDLYLVNGWRLAGAVVVERGKDVLYRNEGNGTFVDVSGAANLGSEEWGSGVAVGDVDSDGWLDLFITNFGTDVLYRNRRDGTFEAVDGGPSLEGWSAGAVLFDADGDGDEDLFVGGYIDCTLDEVLHAEPTLDWEGLKVMKGPFGLEGLANRFFENEGQGRFVDATEKAGLEDSGLFYTFGVMALDLDGDLDLDLYAANDSNPNYVYSNDGKGRFQEVGLWSGAALDAMGNAQAGMGLAAADLESDGRVDLFVTNFQKDASTLYRNLGDLMFEDVSRQVRVSEPTFSRLSWGANLSDLDHDGDLDLFVANGHIYPQADLVPEVSGGFGQQNLLLRNVGGFFEDQSDSSGSGLGVVEVSHGLAVGDIDFDGDLDLAVSNIDAPPTLLRNDSRELGSWLIVDQSDALLIEVETEARTQVRHRVIGGSFLSVSDTRHHFGLGGADQIDRLRLTWSDGSRRQYEDLPANRVIVIPR